MRRLLGLLLLTQLSASVSGQPALQNAITNDREVIARQRERTTTIRDVQGAEVGAVRFSLGASYLAELNDNVRYTEDDPESDFVQIPGINLGVDVPIAERSDLSLRVGVAYRSYWHNEDLSRWTITPGSVIAYDLQVKNVFITLYNRLSYVEDVNTVPDVAGQAQFPRLDNTIGTQVTWLPGDFLVSGGYGFQIGYTPSDDFSYYNRTSHLPFLRGGYVFAEGAANAGMEFSVTLTDYEENISSDSSIVSFGPYLDWQLSDSLRGDLHGGFVYVVNSITLMPEESFDTDSFYVGLNLTHQLTDHISHGLNLSHGVRPSSERAITFTEETNVRYGASWAFLDPATLSLNLTYIRGEQSVAAGLAPSEVYDQWLAGIRLSYSLTERFSASLGYDYVVRDSDLPGRGYTQNRVTLGLGYRFN